MTDPCNDVWCVEDGLYEIPKASAVKVHGRVRRDLFDTPDKLSPLARRAYNTAKDAAAAMAAKGAADAADKAKKSIQCPGSPPGCECRHVETSFGPFYPTPYTEAGQGARSGPQKTAQYVTSIGGEMSWYLDGPCEGKDKNTGSDSDDNDGDEWNRFKQLILDAPKGGSWRGPPPPPPRDTWEPGDPPPPAESQSLRVPARFIASASNVLGSALEGYPDMLHPQQGTFTRFLTPAAPGPWSSRPRRSRRVADHPTRAVGVD